LSMPHGTRRQKVEVSRKNYKLGLNGKWGRNGGEQCKRGGLPRNQGGGIPSTDRARKVWKHCKTGEKRIPPTHAWNDDRRGKRKKKASAQSGHVIGKRGRSLEGRKCKVPNEPCQRGDLHQTGTGKAAELSILTWEGKSPAASPGEKKENCSERHNRTGGGGKRSPTRTRVRPRSPAPSPVFGKKIKTYWKTFAALNGAKHNNAGARDAHATWGERKSLQSQELNCKTSGCKGVTLAVDRGKTSPEVKR